MEKDNPLYETYQRIDDYFHARTPDPNDQKLNMLIAQSQTLLTFIATPEYMDNYGDNFFGLEGKTEKEIFSNLVAGRAKSLTRIIIMDAAEHDTPMPQDTSWCETELVYLLQKTEPTTGVLEQFGMQPLACPQALEVFIERYISGHMGNILVEPYASLFPNDAATNNQNTRKLNPDKHELIYLPHTQPLAQTLADHIGVYEYYIHESYKLELGKLARQGYDNIKYLNGVNPQAVADIQIFQNDPAFEYGYGVMAQFLDAAPEMLEDPKVKKSNKRPGWYRSDN
jgi:hypothetical protein